jgi:hypothetical protein
MPCQQGMGFKPCSWNEHKNLSNRRGHTGGKPEGAALIPLCGTKCEGSACIKTSFFPASAIHYGRGSVETIGNHPDS